MSGRPGEAAAVILAAGRSERLADPVLKPFRRLAGQPMIEYSLRAFEESESVTGVVVVVPEGLREGLEASLGARPKVVAVTGGGRVRQDSLARGLACVPPGAEVVAIHDAARPMVTPAFIDAVVAAVAEGFDGAISAVPVDDAIKEVAEDGEILRPRSRVGLWRAQTPQAFARECLETSLAKALADGIVCDDCSEMATRAGYRVRIVPGDPRNVKVTRPGDLELCERLLDGRP